MVSEIPQLETSTGLPSRLRKDSYSSPPVDIGSLRALKPKKWSPTPPAPALNGFRPEGVTSTTPGSEEEPPQLPPRNYNTPSPVQMRKTSDPPVHPPSVTSSSATDRQESGRGRSEAPSLSPPVSSSGRASWGSWAEHESSSGDTASQRTSRTSSSVDRTSLASSSRQSGEQRTSLGPPAPSPGTPGGETYKAQLRKVSHQQYHGMRSGGPPPPPSHRRSMGEPPLPPRAVPSHSRSRSDNARPPSAHMTLHPRTVSSDDTPRGSSESSDNASASPTVRSDGKLPASLPGESSEQQLQRVSPDKPEALASPQDVFIEQARIAEYGPEGAYNNKSAHQQQQQQNLTSPYAVSSVVQPLAARPTGQRTASASANPQDTDQSPPKSVRDRVFAFEGPESSGQRPGSASQQNKRRPIVAQDPYVQAALSAHDPLSQNTLPQTSAPQNSSSRHSSRRTSRSQAESPYSSRGGSQSHLESPYTRETPPTRTSQSQPESPYSRDSPAVTSSQTPQQDSQTSSGVSLLQRFDMQNQAANNPSESRRMNRWTGSSNLDRRHASGLSSMPPAVNSTPPAALNAHSAVNHTPPVSSSPAVGAMPPVPNNTPQAEPESRVRRRESLQQRVSRESLQPQPHQRSSSAVRHQEAPQKLSTPLTDVPQKLISSSSHTESSSSSPPHSRNNSDLQKHNNTHQHRPSNTSSSSEGSRHQIPLVAESAPAPQRKESPPASVTCHHTRQKSLEELECDAAAVALAATLERRGERKLSVALVQRTAVQYLESVRPAEQTTGENHVRQTSGSESLGASSDKVEKGAETTHENPESPLPPNSAYWSSPGSASMHQRMREDETPKKAVENLDTDALHQKKVELVSRMRRKLEVLREEQGSLQAEVDENSRLGDSLKSLVNERCSSEREKKKYESYVSDLDDIMKLLLSLSGRLARAENALSSLPATEDDGGKPEKKQLEHKRQQLQRQHEEALALKADIDRRAAQVTRFLPNYLSPDQLADYTHFIDMKSRLTIDAQDIEDKIQLATDQIDALEASLGHRTTSES